MQIQFHRSHWPKLFIASAGLWLFFTVPAWAAEKPAEEEQIWASAILDAVYTLPTVRAAESDFNSAGHFSRAAGRPLYNPEVNAGFDDKPGREFLISINQQFDWSGKRTARTRVAKTQLKSAGYRLAAVKNEIFSESLITLNEYASANQNAILAAQQVALLEQLLRTIEDRLEAGDLGLLDAELARLTLSEALHNAAQADREKRLAQGLVEVTLGRTIGDSLPRFGSLEVSGMVNAERYLPNIPALAETQLLYQTALGNIDVARRERKADPTFSIGAGKDGDDSVMALSLSMPLNIRNRYTDEMKAMQELAISAELTYINQRRVALTTLETTRKAYELISHQWRRWKQVTGQRFDRSAALLKQLWEVGEITTADYVFGLQQRALAIQAGNEFSKDVFGAWIDWLDASGRTESWLRTLAPEHNQTTKESLK